VYCRTVWDDGKGKEAGHTSIEEGNEEGYMNLGKLVGASSVRGKFSIRTCANGQILVRIIILRTVESAGVELIPQLLLSCR
jgi:hypothetical protein